MMDFVEYYREENTLNSAIVKPIIEYFKKRFYIGDILDYSKNNKIDGYVIIPGIYFSCDGEKCILTVRKDRFSTSVDIDLITGDVEIEDSDTISGSIEAMWNLNIFIDERNKILDKLCEIVVDIKNEKLISVD